VDSLFGIIAVVGTSISLSYAAIKDYKTREVPNWLWVGGLVILPLTLLRIIPVGLLLFYGAQLLVSLLIVLLGFRFSVLGGADGKAILLIALTYPWIVIEAIWLLLAPIGILIGGFLIVGGHSLVLLILNAIYWRRWSDHSEDLKPVKSTYWLTRRLKQSQKEGLSIIWVPVSVPLVVYILMTYAAMLSWMVITIFGWA
jgi:Flp pilus assembly protein protease CpaA